MKTYESPIIEVVDELTLEPVYASSGSTTTTETEEKPLDSCEWSVKTNWTGHNGGSHSDLQIMVQHHGSCCGECVRMHFYCQGFKLDKIQDTSGYIACNQTESGFDFIRNGHFNPTESIGFTIQVRAKDGMYQGAVAKSGDFASEAGKNVVCTSCYGS